MFGTFKLSCRDPKQPTKIYEASFWGSERILYKIYFMLLRRFLVGSNRETIKENVNCLEFFNTLTVWHIWTPYNFQQLFKTLYDWLTNSWQRYCRIEKYFWAVETWCPVHCLCGQTRVTAVNWSYLDTDDVAKRWNSKMNKSWKQNKCQCWVIRSKYKTGFLPSWKWLENIFSY